MAIMALDPDLRLKHKKKGKLAQRVPKRRFCIDIMIFLYFFYVAIDNCRGQGPTSTHM